MQQALILEDQADSALWLERALGEAFPGITVRAVRTLAEARLLLPRWRPDIALIDLGLPDGNGLDLIGELSRLYPDCLSVVSTIYNDDGHLFPALRAGAKGYLLKEQTQQQIVELLRRIASGEPPLSPAIARRLLQTFAPEPEAAEALAPREREVLALIARGYKLSAVAQALGIAQSTAAGYVKSIYRKLNVSSRAEAALQAARRGLVPPN